MEKVSPNVKFLNKEDFSSICRLCLMQGPMASIFELKYEESLFSEILFELFSTQVNSEDELPKNVCETCISQIICFYNYKKVFIASERILQAVVTKEANRKIHRPILCDEEIKLEDFINTISCNDLNEDITGVKKELDIDKTYELNDQELTLEDQIINVYNSNEKNEIRIDSITTTDNTDTTNDFLDNREDSGKIQKDISSTVNVDCQVRHLANGVKKKRKPLQPKIFTCSCQETFSIWSEYIKHRKEVKHPRPRNHTCKICSKNFEKASLKCHMRTHTKEKPYGCKICLDRFGQAGSLNRHMMLHTGAKPYVCEFCGKGFTRAPYLASHMTTHTGEKPFLCTYCAKTYIDSRSYEVHLKKHADNKSGKSHQCQFCQKGFTTGAALEAHLSIHGEKKFLCSHCGKKFHTSVTLRTHLRVHTRAKPYSCTVCDRSFSHSATLKTHMLTHTGDKPYQCIICSKTFSLRHNLKAHLRRHSGEKPYTCPYCKKAFSDNRNLGVHIRIHTGETPHMCDLCPRGFYDSTSLKRHRKRHLKN